QVKHRPGPFKQTNKSHKHGKHRSKGKLDEINSGRVGAKSISRRLHHALSKQQRQNRLSQIRKHKRQEVLTKKRGIGNLGSVPHIIAVIPLSLHAVDSNKIVNDITSCDETANIIKGYSGTTLVSNSYKATFTILQPPLKDLYACLDAAKIADTILFVLSASNEIIDSYGHHCLSCLFAQGLPTSIVTAQGIINHSGKKQHEIKRNIQKIVLQKFSKEKWFHLDTQQDAQRILRIAATTKLQKITYREIRPYLLAETVEFNECDSSDNGVLQVTGYLRGHSLSANNLVYIPGSGEYQLLKITAPPNPSLNSNSRRSSTDQVIESMEEDMRVLDEADPAMQETLIAEADIDTLNDEQTWPTEEELQQADERKQKMKRNRKFAVPAGTSSYQACWIDDDADDDENNFSNDDIPDAVEYDHDEPASPVSYHAYSSHEGESKTVTFSTVMDGDAINYDQEMDWERERTELEKMRAEKEDRTFPDEIDTPLNIPAREAFIDYRGLRSFRTSPWDPKEDLPRDYSRIFQFQNFKHTRKVILSSNEESNVQIGWYVTLHIKNVPRDIADNLQTHRPLVIFGLLQHEQKASLDEKSAHLLNISFKVILIVDRMMFQVGFRRFSASPMFSQHSTGNKHKLERFFRTNEAIVATMYCPIMFPPAPVIVFRENEDGGFSLVATGSLLNVNPDRTVVEKIVLSGHPYKIHKRIAVIRYMFFNREDIAWFKPVELYSKFGRRGHIKEALGTHGHMKCIFDKQLKAHDTICMNLYKRNFPIWDYNPIV
ncbi:uncharacterized protein TRIADDRAFT_527, partial [Trichoplax adhaerens]